MQYSPDQHLTILFDFQCLLTLEQPAKKDTNSQMQFRLLSCGMHNKIVHTNQVYLIKTYHIMSSKHQVQKDIAPFL